MDKYTRLKEKFANKGQIIGTNITLINSSPLIELINEDYLDFILFDMEHGIFNNENLIGVLQTCRLIGLPSFVRVPETTYHHISRCIDLGADGVMIPRVETLDQLKKVVESLRFPPVGCKGRGGYRQLRVGETTKDLQTNRHLLIQIESVLGAFNLEEMLSKYGKEVASVVVGPYDLSISMGLEMQFTNPIFVSEIERVFAICKKHNVSVGIFCDTPESATYWKQKGANFFWMCTDDELIIAGMRSLIKPVSKL